MNFNFLEKSVLTLVLLGLCALPVVASSRFDGSDIFKEKKPASMVFYQKNPEISHSDLAKLILPEQERHYTLDQWIVASICFVLEDKTQGEDIKQDFFDGWTAIYKAIGTPGVERLPVKKETSHMQCFLGSLIFQYRAAEQNPSKFADCLEMQKNEIYFRFTVSLTHMAAIETENLDLHVRLKLWNEQ